MLLANLLLGFILITLIALFVVAVSNRSAKNDNQALSLSTKSALHEWFSRLFNRDAYDSQELLDRVNRILVSQTDPEKLVVASTEVLRTMLKVEFCHVVLNDKKHQYGWDKELEGLFKDIADLNKDNELNKTLGKSKTRHIVTGNLGGKRARELQTLLKSNNVGFVFSLRAAGIGSHSQLGALILGNKQNGGAFTAQDKRVLRIVGDELAIAVQNAVQYEKIEEFAATLQAKVDEATKKLRRTNEKLKTLDETKDEFISMASHQLRTPLTSVKGYLSMVIEGDVGKVTDPQKKMLEQAFTSSQRMVYLIADLLNVSRLKNGKFIIEAAPANLDNMVQGEIDQLKESAKLRQLNLVYTKPKQVPDLMLDETKTRQVIMNFIDNAIYYTPEGGKIDVSLTETDKSIEFTVKDTGIGVPKDERHNLFTKFYRAGNARKARPDGTGLGLFMAKKVIVAQGGAIIFDTTEGRGSTFGFSFDKAKLAPKAP